MIFCLKYAYVISTSTLQPLKVCEFSFRSWQGVLDIRYLINCKVVLNANIFSFVIFLVHPDLLLHMVLFSKFSFRRIFHTITNAHIFWSVPICIYILLCIILDIFSAKYFSVVQMKIKSRNSVFVIVCISMSKCIKHVFFKTCCFKWFKTLYSPPFSLQKNATKKLPFLNETIVIYGNCCTFLLHFDIFVKCQTKNINIWHNGHDNSCLYTMVSENKSWCNFFFFESLMFCKKGREVSFMQNVNCLDVGRLLTEHASRYKFFFIQNYD